MSDHRSVLRMLVVVCIVVFTAGCSVDTSGERQVGLETGDVVAETDGGYRFESRLSAVAQRTDDRTYTNVTVTFYANRTVLMESIPIGSVSTVGNGIPISVSLRSPPEYVIVSSPDFTKDEKLTVFNLKRNGSRYTAYIRDASDPFTTSSTVTGTLFVRKGPSAETESGWRLRHQDNGCRRVIPGPSR